MSPAWRASAPALAVVCLAALLPLRAEQPPSPEGLTVFISDLHFGLGRDAETADWHPTEDFRWETEFLAFLQEIDRQGAGRTELVVLGDMFELWQPLDPRSCRSADANLGCDEASALARLEPILAAHGSVLRALGRFAGSGANRVAIVPGNHDAALVFPAVARRVVAAIDAPQDRVVVLREGEWRSADGRILADHGHQIGRDLNRFDQWPAPFVGEGGRHLQRTWGEQFVDYFYNPFEAKYPILDNILENGVGAGYVVRAEGTVGTARAVGRFLGFFLTKLSWSHMAAVLGEEGEEPVWDLNAIRRQGDRFLVESFPPGPWRDAASTEVSAGTLGITLEELTLKEIEEICRNRQALQPRPGSPLSQNEVPAPCPTLQLGAISSAALRVTWESDLRMHLQEAARTNPQARRVGLYVYGHTHHARGPRKLVVSERDSWNVQVVNTGAWQRVIGTDRLERLRCKRAAAEVLMSRPEILPACYGTVFVAPGSAGPEARLKVWSADGDNTWAFRDACVWHPPPCG